MYNIYFRKTYLTVVFLFVLFNKSIAQTKYAGIEIGAKGVKTTILTIENVKKGIYTLDKYWSENTSITKGISIDGNLSNEDIDYTSNVVLQNFDKLVSEYSIDKNNIFIVASSGVGMAKNTKELVEKIKEFTGKKLDVISIAVESKLLAKGGIPPNRYLDSTILDIGGGNTKGGYAEGDNKGNTIFMPLGLNLGTITLTEKIKKKATSNELSEFLEQTTTFNDSLNIAVNKMYDLSPISKHKKNIYLSGGAVWAFITLSSETPNVDNFHEFTLDELNQYQVRLINNYATFEKLAETNKEAEKVLKTYSQKYLISANNLLLSVLNNLESPKEKKYYFSKQGQIAWLLAYVVDSSKGTKHIL